MVSERRQAGPALAVNVDGVDRHDDRTRLRPVRHQDADLAGSHADREVGRPEEENRSER